MSKAICLLAILLLCLLDQASASSPSSVMKCRHAVSMNFGRAKKTAQKVEGSITCDHPGQVCARVFMQGLMDSNKVEVHAASCINETLCSDDEPCGIEDLFNVSHVESFQKVHACKKHCCSGDHCNSHKKPNPKQEAPVTFPVMKCRHAVSIDFGKEKKMGQKFEGSIICDNPAQVCARIFMQGRIGSDRVGMHAASCMNASLCPDEEYCGIEELFNMSSVERFQKVHFCKTHCCFDDHCNTRKKPKTEKSQKDVERLSCYEGVIERDADGYLISREMEQVKCLFGGKGSIQSRCLLAEISSTNIVTNSTMTTTQAHCMHEYMCSSVDCETVQSALFKEGNFTVNHCNITCCNTHFCNNSSGRVNFEVLIVLFALLLSSFVEAHVVEM